jgi:hypothetical protein
MQDKKFDVRAQFKQPSPYSGTPVPSEGTFLNNCLLKVTAVWDITPCSLIQTNISEAEDQSEGGNVRVRKMLPNFYENT